MVASLTWWFVFVAARQRASSLARDHDRIAGGSMRRLSIAITRHAHQDGERPNSVAMTTALS
jgi:hypothetical protein